MLADLSQQERRDQPVQDPGAGGGLRQEGAQEAQAGAGVAARRPARPRPPRTALFIIDDVFLHKLLFNERVRPPPCEVLMPCAR